MLGTKKFVHENLQHNDTVKPETLVLLNLGEI